MWGYGLQFPDLDWKTHSKFVQQGPFQSTPEARFKQPAVILPFTYLEEPLKTPSLWLTGYVGGSLFALLDKQKYQVTALVRWQEIAQQCQKLNVIPIMGDFKLLELIEKLSYGADVVVNLASCDDLQNLEEIDFIYRSLKDGSYRFNLRSQEYYKARDRG